MQNNETRIVKPSVNMLPIDKIREALAKTIQAKDTDFVAEIPSGEIAKCYSGERDSVYNAYHLGKRPAHEYLTIDDNPNDAIVASNLEYDKEISALRLELYRVYEILNAQLGSNYEPESGYIENFIDIASEEKESITAQIAIPDGSTTKIVTTKTDFALPKEYIVLEDESNFAIAQIRSVDEQGYTLEGYIDMPSDKDIKITKILGENLNNSFSFSHTVKDGVSKESHNVVLGDYEIEEKLPVNSGIATDIFVKRNMLSLNGNQTSAVLSGVRVYVEKSRITSPELVCKIYKINNTNEDGTLDLEQIGISKSQEIHSDKWVNFDITNNNHNVVVDNESHLLVAFECASDNNFVIMGGKGKNNDLHTYRSIYTKTEEGYKKNDETQCDLLLSLNFKEIIDELTTARDQGLYTSKTFVNNKPNNRRAQLHVKLKNIEKTKVAATVPVDGMNGFVVENQLRELGYIAVGNDVCYCQKIENNTVFTENHVAVYPKDIVYSIPIKAQIITMSELFETQLPDNKLIKEVVEMDAVRVAGDYLIFECMLPQNVKRFKVQIAYRNNVHQIKAAALESIGVSLI